MGPYLGVHGAPWVRQKRTLRISPFSSKICLTKLPKVLRDRLAGTPKLVYGGPCTQKSAGKPSILSQGTTKSLWGPTVGSPGHLGSSKIQLGKFSPFSSQICPTKRARRRAQRFFATPKPACGGPCGQKSAGRPSILSQDTTQSLWDPTVGSPGHPGSGKTQLGKKSPFSSQISPTRRVRRRTQRFFATPKPACRGPCRQKSAGRSSILSQDTTQSLWDPTVGSPGHPGSSKTQLGKISPFSSQGCPTKRARSGFWRPLNPPAGVPAGKQTLGCRLQCPRTPHNQYGTPPWGPWGTLGPAK